MRGFSDRKITQSSITDIRNYNASNKLKIYKGPALEYKISITDKKVCNTCKSTAIYNINDTQFYCQRHCPETYVSKEKLPTAAKRRAHIKRKQYEKRKWLGIQYCNIFLTKQSEKWQTFFECHNKKDDLADACLQGLHYLKINI